MKKIYTIISTLFLFTIGASAQKTWTGLAGDGLWASPTNWSGNLAPVSTDNVLLDNSTVAGTYIVTLPAGSVSTAINSLTITPSGINNITLILPSTNTAAAPVGLRVGDGVAGNYDVIINNGGILKNSSTASAGNGFETNSLTLDSLKINNGGRFVHNSSRSSSGSVSILSKSTGTETGIYEFDYPGSGTPSASGRTYGTLIYSKTSGAGTYAISGGSPLTIRGNFIINTGVTVTSTMTGALILSGDFINNGPSYSTATQKVVFNGGTLQNITGTGTYTFASGTNTSDSITVGTTVATALALTFNGAVFVDGAFQINQGGFASGTGTWTYRSTGKLIFNNTTGSYGVNNDVYWPVVNGPNDVTVAGAGGITMNVARTVPGTFQTAAGVTTANNLTFNGFAKINSGGYFLGSPTYGNTSTLVYNTSGNYGRGQEWNATSGAGYPNNVQVSNSTALDVGSSSPGTALQIAGTLTVDAGSGFYMDFGSNNMTAPVTILGNVVLNGNLSLSNSVGGDLKVGGNWTRTTGFFAPHSRAVFFNAATGNQTILNTAGETFDYVILDKAAGNLVLANNVTFNQTLFLTNGILSTGSNKAIISATGGINRTNGWVSGNLQKNIATGPTVASFEIGDGTYYTPVTVSFANVTGAGSLTAKSTAGDHPQIGTSGLNANKTANRYWTLTNTGITFTTYSAVFNFVPADLDQAATPTSFVVAKYDLGAWTLPTTGTRTSTSTQATGVSSFSDFAVGNLSPLPITIEYIRGFKQALGNLLEWKVGCASSPYAILSLERSADGINFSGVYDITATAVRCQQQFDHVDQPLPGMNYYRLKMVDESGLRAYSAVIGMLNKDKGFGINMLPSVVRSGTILKVISARAVNMQFVITDMQGRIVQNGSYPLVAGGNQVNLDLSKLSSGSYTISAITIDKDKAVLEFIKE